MLNEKLILSDYSNYVKLVSEAYLLADDFDSSVVHHWESLNRSNYVLFQRLISKVDVVFTTNDKDKVGRINIGGRDFRIEYIRPNEEYKTQSEMKNSFKRTGILRISIDYSEHPFFTVKDNIVFRTVHDYIAHILGDYDFGAKGEIGCYNLHSKMAPKNAKPALFTEVVGQASVAVVHNIFPKQKIAVLKGFDFDNIGLVDNEEYEILDKELIKKGETIEKVRKNREEPKALHIGDDKELELSHFIRKKLKTTLLEYFNKKSRD